MKTILLFTAFVFLQIELVKAQAPGAWIMSANGLPVYQYTGKLPFKALDKEGKDAMLPEDPYFLIGNYRMTLITHVSGVYQFLTAERAWARINAASRPNYGWNDASVVFKTGTSKGKVALTGLNSMAADPAKTQSFFGIGHARYEYKLDNSIACTRIISCKPSQKINTGNPSFVITVLLKNNGRKKQELVYSERMLVNFVINGTQYTDNQKKALLYSSKITGDDSKKMAVANLSYKTNTLLALPNKNERYIYDVNPPSVYMYVDKEDNRTSSVVDYAGDTLATSVTISLNPGETKTAHLVIGLADGDSMNDISQQVDDLFAGADKAHPSEGLYAQQWKAKLPDLSSEKNMVLRREMLWNAHVIEASAKYSDYYKETFIPQGTVYSYHYGDNISNRDHLQAALAACYTNPELAKSCIRYVVKHSEKDGEIKRGNSGYGYSVPTIYKESDEQLYFFNTVAEYLRITKDYKFLDELVVHYPAEDGKQDHILNMLKRYFIYLRDEVGLGSNGLVKMLNSDWSDSFFHKHSPNSFASSAESHLNSAMVLAVFPRLIEALKLSGNKEASDFIIALEDYRATLNSSYMKDLGDSKFSPRAYLNRSLRFGKDNVCIEPQGYLLQIPDLPKERKKEIYEFVKSKISTPEKIGIRTREKPLWGGKADGEDGGIWYSLEYPLLLGVATFDKEEAKSLLMKFSFQNYSETYPDYWVGQWTAPDEMNSSLHREGLYAFWVSVPDLKQAFQGYCSHPHTWPLYCYYKLKE
ncbi:MAG: hypothetical protein H7Y03_14185 [Chitinophagaceae bacterium]|nr:hypothetical protein [Chitinophagaceae bacterium]